MTLRISPDVAARRAALHKASLPDRKQKTEQEEKDRETLREPSMKEHHRSDRRSVVFMLMREYRMQGHCKEKERERECREGKKEP